MKKISWDEYLKDIEKLITKIEESGFKPNLIYTFPRGGFIPATIMSHHFDDAHIIFNLNRIEKHNKASILILDDLCDTGKTFLNESLPILGENVRTAALYRKSHSVFYPHFLVEDNLDKDEWIVFPYEKEPEDEKKAIEAHIQPLVLK